MFRGSTFDGATVVLRMLHYVSDRLSAVIDSGSCALRGDAAAHQPAMRAPS
jgi:hypothetical protein